MTLATPLAQPSPDPSPIAVDGLGHPVWLVRHAPTSWTGRRWCGRADPPLNSEGRTVARDLAATIHDDVAAVGIAPTIRSSPARRARATATALGRAGRWPITVDDDLLEVDVGVAEGLTWAELSDRHPDLAAVIASGDRVDWPGGESVAAVHERARRASERIVVDARTGPVIVVSHGALLHAIVASMAVAPPTHFFAPGGILPLVPAVGR